MSHRNQLVLNHFNRKEQNDLNYLSRKLREEEHENTSAEMITGYGEIHQYPVFNNSSHKFRY